MFISLKDSRRKVEVLGTEAQVWWALQYFYFRADIDTDY